MRIQLEDSGHRIDRSLALSSTLINGVNQQSIEVPSDIGKEFRGVQAVYL